MNRQRLAMLVLKGQFLSTMLLMPAIRRQLNHCCCLDMSAGGIAYSKSCCQRQYQCSITKRCLQNTVLHRLCVEAASAMLQLVAVSVRPAIQAW
jgi:hypothetical protein